MTGVTQDIADRRAAGIDLPCDSEPHGEDIAAASMADLMARSMMLSAGEPALGRVWSPGEGVRDMRAEANGAIADARRDQADAAFRNALGELCRVLGIPVPARHMASVARDAWGRLNASAGL